MWPIAARPVSSRSTGNLYWTSKIYNEFGPDISVGWRAGKNNIPGNEVAPYTENGDDRYFRDIVYTNPGGFYGYFVATYQTAGVLSSQIKRVPLTGGPAVVIANCPAPIARDLVTDGARLFWVDSGVIRSAPLGWADHDAAGRGLLYYAHSPRLLLNLF